MTRTKTPATPTKVKHPMAPTPAQVRAAREAGRMTLAEAGAVVHVHGETWRNWERPDSAQARHMHPAFWELFNLKMKLAQAEPEPAPRPVFQRAG